MDVILFVSSLEGGGAERIVATIADNLPQSINREIVTISELPSKYPHTSDRLSLLSGVKYKIKPVTIVAFVKYLQYLQNHHPDVCISALAAPNLINILAMLYCKIPTIISVHEMPSQKDGFGLLHTIYNSITYLITRHSAAHVIAVSNGVKEELITYSHIPAKKIHVIYNPININLIDELSAEIPKNTSIPSEIPIIITVGSLKKIKAQWHLIHAFASLRKTHPCHLLICGDGVLKNTLTSLVEEYGISNDVSFLGWQENPYQFMVRSSVFVLSSISEALPNVIVESMACGCPVVAANCSPGIEELLGSDNSCGLITKKMSGICHTADEPLDEGELDLLEAMKKILNDADLRERMSVACRNRAKLFDLDVGIQKYVELIEKVGSK